MINILIIILIAILALGIVFAIIKKAVKFAIYAIIIVIIGSIIIMFIVANDLSSFKKHSEEGISYIFINSNGEIIKGFSIKDDKVSLISQGECEVLKNKAEDKEDIDGLIIITELEGDSINSNSSILNSDENIEELESPINLINNIKSGATKIYPEKVSFKALKYVPKIFVNNIANLID